MDWYDRHNKTYLLRLPGYLNVARDISSSSISNERGARNARKAQREHSVGVQAHGDRGELFPSDSGVQQGADRVRPSNTSSYHKQRVSDAGESAHRKFSGRSSIASIGGEVQKS